MPTVALFPVLWEVAGIVEQIFTVAATCDLRDVTPEDPEAAIHSYQAGHGLTATRLRDVLRSSLTAMREVDELCRKAKLMRIYAKCWRPLAPEGRHARARKAAQARCAGRS